MRYLLLALLALAAWRVARRVRVVEPVFTSAKDARWAVDLSDGAQWKAWEKSQDGSWTASVPMPPGTILRRVVDGQVETWRWVGEWP